MITGVGWAWLAGAVLASLLAAYAVWRGRSRCDTIATLAVGAGFFAAHVAVSGVPTWGRYAHQPAWIAVGATLFAAAMALRSPEARSCVWLASVLASVGLIVIVWPSIRGEWGDAGLPVVIVCGAALGFGALATLFLVTGAAAGTPGTSVPASVAITAAGAAVLALLSHYASFAQLGGALALGLAPLCVALLARKSPVTVPGVTLAASAMTLGLLMGGFLHVLETDRVGGPWFCLAGAAPVLGCLASLGARGEAPGRKRAVLRVAIAVVAVGAAVAGGVITSSGDAPPGTDTQWEDEWETGR